ncbi:putative glycoside hydrolase [Dyella japonica]|uniref:DUF4015 domain-containing protein n=1 Tax=Dyella japonica TaxID=231455 RepID=A0ABV2JP79_9GAMM
MSYAVVGSTVTGRVLDAATGLPVPDALVTIQGRVWPVGTHGEFAVDTDSDLVQVRAPGYRAEHRYATEEPVIFHMHSFRPRAVYLSTYGVANGSIREPVFKLIDEGVINALVIDVKGDRGQTSYRSHARIDWGAQAHSPMPAMRDLGVLIGSLREQGVYLIARIVTFKDEPLAAAHPEWAVRRADGGPWRDNEQSRWIDPSNEQAWGHYAALAEEVALLGFDEIQFDYVRFPDAQGLVFTQPNTKESRTRMIGSFLQAMREKLAPYNVFLSADIFGYVCWNRNDTGIGQQLEDLGERVDYISPMLYPSSFTWGIEGLAKPTDDPGQIVRRSLAQAQARTGLPGVRFRPWLQAFRDYAFDRRPFGRDELRSQMEAAVALGSDGWMLWNPRNQYPDVSQAFTSTLPRIDGGQ